MKALLIIALAFVLPGLAVAESRMWESRKHGQFVGTLTWTDGIKAKVVKEDGTEITEFLGDFSNSDFKYIEAWEGSGSVPDGDAETVTGSFVMSNKPGGNLRGVLWTDIDSKVIEERGEWKRVQVTAWVYSAEKAGLTELDDFGGKPMRIKANMFKDAPAKKAPAEPKAGEGKGKPLIENWKWDNYGGDNIKIEGVVVNNSAKTLKLAKIDIVLSDANAKYLGNASTYLDRKSLAPGQRSTFTAYCSDATNTTSTLKISYTIE
ncbi:MAG: FxLYD domain-containing protein [Verrucomicrobiota bacterium]